MSEITYRKAYNDKGHFEDLLIIQDGNVVHLSLDRGNSQGKSQWDNAKTIIDRFAAEVADESSDLTKKA